MQANKDLFKAASVTLDCLDQAHESLDQAIEQLENCMDFDAKNASEYRDIIRAIKALKTPLKCYIIDAMHKTVKGLELDPTDDTRGPFFAPSLND